MRNIHSTYKDKLKVQLKLFYLATSDIHSGDKRRALTPYCSDAPRYKRMKNMHIKVGSHSSADCSGAVKLPKVRELRLGIIIQLHIIKKLVSIDAF